VTDKLDLHELKVAKAVTKQLRLCKLNILEAMQIKALCLLICSLRADQLRCTRKAKSGG
jgi:hypothetical protein